MPRTTDVITPLLCLGVLISLGSAVYSRSKYTAVLDRAEKIAETRIGDKYSPLTEPERTDWYKEMNVREGENPTRMQLMDYIDKYSSKN